MRTFLPVVLSFCAAAAFAQPAPGKVPPPAPKNVAFKAPHAIDPAIRSNMLAKTGGLIHSAPTAPFVLFLNTQKRVPDQALQDLPGLIQKVLRLPCVSLSKPSAEPVAEAVNALADTNNAAVIVIGDAAGYPALLVAPESRWALVNVAALAGSGASAETLAERVQRETWRAFGYLMGAANSTSELCLMKPVFSAADLDALKARTLSPETFSKIMTQALKMGMKPTRLATYRKAVEEGWAPSPTNDFQRAIWQELKK